MSFIVYEVRRVIPHLQVDAPEYGPNATHHTATLQNGPRKVDVAYKVNHDIVTIDGCNMSVIEAIDFIVERLT